ncbi:hypothetical protein L1987_15747 [Smallanthus sonchifolius]|uniref:Uncharacterized protein n=1 Tax=Smallanthus sonchifolius TaxID=185202 RepID=A0ACB9J7G4_9ASTR|nr:hypothetical protein L1987_15747 [Smallanthus sonchifolius]
MYKATVSASASEREIKIINLRLSIGMFCCTLVINQTSSLRSSTLIKPHTLGVLDLGYIDLCFSIWVLRFRFLDTLRFSIPIRFFISISSPSSGLLVFQIAFPICCFTLQFQSLTEMASPPTTIDQLGIDLLGNILARLPAVDFASANGSSSLLHHGCRRVLCRPKLSSACSLNPSLQVAVEEVVNKILSQPMRPQFAIATHGYGFHFKEAEELIKAKLGSNFPVITNKSRGFMGRDGLSEEFKETRWKGDNSDIGIMLTVGFLPGMEVKKIPLHYDEQVPRASMINTFVTDIREFSTSISGCKSPAAIIMFSLYSTFNTTDIMEKLDYEMSPETVIVGDFGCDFKNTHTDGGITVRTAAVALVFAKNRNKPPGIGETQFHSVSSSGMLPLGPSYEVTSFKKAGFPYTTSFTAKREGSHENLNGEIILKQAHDEGKNHSSFAWRAARREGSHEEGKNHSSFAARREGSHEERGDRRPWYIGVTKRRKCSNGQEKAGLMTSFAFHKVVSIYKEDLFVKGLGLEKGDTFRLYLPDSATALSSAASVSNHLRSFKQGSTSGGDKREVFGGLIFTSCTRDESFFDQASVENSSFLDNFAGVTLGVTLCSAAIGRVGDLTPESQEQRCVRGCVNEYGAAYLIMSYAP